MKNLGLSMAVSIGLSVFLLTAATPTKAATPTMLLDIPFQFMAGDVVLPAGTYVVQQLDGFPILDLKSTRECVSHRVVLSRRVERKGSPPENGILRFHKYGDKIVLQAIWSPWRSEGFELRPSKTMIELARADGAVPGITIDAHSK